MEKSAGTGCVTREFEELREVSKVEKLSIANNRLLLICIYSPESFVYESANNLSVAVHNLHFET
jgi:hypothetical protein